MEAAASEVTREKSCCSPYLRKGGMRERREEEEGGLEGRRHQGDSLLREPEEKLEGLRKE